MSQLIDGLNKKQEQLQLLMNEEAKRQGRLEELEKQLKGLGLDSLEEAEAELQRLMKEVSEKEQRLIEIDVELGRMIENAKSIQKTL